MLALSMPEPGWWTLAAIAFVPFVIAVWDEKPIKSFWYGILTGVVYNAVIIWWITLFGYLPWIILVLYQALYFGMFAVITSFFKPQRSGLLLFLALPCAWVLLQWFRTFGTYAFPWGSLAHTQIPNIGLLQIASITGSYGIDFILFLFNIMVCILLICAKYRKLASSILLFLIVSITAYSIFFIMSDKNISDDYISAKVAIIQRSEETGVTATRHEVMNAAETYRNLTLKAGDLNPDFIVWPETALPVAVTLTGWGSFISNLALITNSHLVAGVIEPYDDDFEYNYNSAFIYNNTGDMIGKYRKVKLVPFGEFVPARNKLPFLEKYQIRETDVIAGEEHNLISTDYGEIGIVICFESLFPAISREIVHNGADLLFVLTNDSWFEESFAAKQHLYFSVLRAVESRRSIVRSAATGISAFIDPYGQIVSQTNLFEETILSGDTHIAKHNTKNTFYTRYGDWFVYLCMVLFAICFVLNFALSKHSGNGCELRRNHQTQAE